jgi:hypothetical protein
LAPAKNCNLYVAVNNVMNSALAMERAAFQGLAPAAALQTCWKCAEYVPDRSGIDISWKRKNNPLISKKIIAAKIVTDKNRHLVLPQHKCHSATFLMRLIQAEDYPR